MKYKADRAGLRDVLRSPGVRQLVDDIADAKTAAAGDGFEKSSMFGQVRYRAIIYPKTFKAQRRERRENILLRILG